MRTAAVIQARMGSTRLPGKVLRPLAGRPVLAHVIERVRACPRLERVVVATTDRPRDDAIARVAGESGSDVFRGDEDDVLARYYNAARGEDIVVRITADCPLFDPAVLDRMLATFCAATASGEIVDYLSNTLVRTFPRGLDAELMTFAALERAHREATQPFEREHVTPYIYMHPDRFVTRNFSNTSDLSHLRWTLDTQEDWHLITTIYQHLYSKHALFTTEAVLALLREHPSLVRINAHVEQQAVGPTSVLRVEGRGPGDVMGDFLE